MSLTNLQVKVDSIRCIIGLEVPNLPPLVGVGILERSADEIIRALDIAVIVVQSAGQHILSHGTHIDELIQLIDEVHDEIRLIKKKN